MFDEGGSQRYYIAGGVRRRRKTGKHGKVEVKRKRWVLAQPSYYLQVNGRQSPWVEPGGIDHSMQRTQGGSIIKGWEDKRDCGCILDTLK